MNILTIGQFWIEDKVYGKETGNKYRNIYDIRKMYRLRMIFQTKKLCNWNINLVKILSVWKWMETSKFHLIQCLPQQNLWCQYWRWSLFLPAHSIMEIQGMLTEPGMPSKLHQFYLSCEDNAEPAGPFLSIMASSRW